MSRGDHERDCEGDAERVCSTSVNGLARSHVGPDELAGCTEGSPEAAELAAITEGLEDHELKWWLLGLIPGLKAVAP
jgi:hypothetical protein